MKRKTLSILVASLFVPALAQGQEPQREWSGSLSVGVRQVGINANDPSKFNEYRDLPEGTTGFLGAEARRRGESSYLNLYGENIGRDDQYLNLDGGSYGNHKFRVYQDMLRHNFGSGPGAKTPYFGAGTSTLDATLPSLNPNTWNTFDHSYKRRDTGGFFEWQRTSPFYFRVDANEVKRDGINVFAGAKGTSPGNGFMDLPAPIDYTTRNISGEVGYSTRRSHVAFNVMRSNFDNGNDVLRWRNDFFGNGLDTTVLPPDNEYTRFALNGNLRGLPADSTLSGRITWSTLESNVAMQPTMLSTGGANPVTNPSDPTFKGDHNHQTLGLALASRPGRNVDTRVYFNYDKLKNDSTHMTFNPPVGSGLRGGSTDPRVNCANVAGSLCEPEMFHYTKKNIGLEAGYRLTRNSKVMGGLDWIDSERERADFQDSKETRLFAEYKSAFTDSLSGRIKYQYMKRSSDFNPHEAVLLANPMDLYVRRFDLANAKQHQLKLVLDQNFPNQVDVGFEMILKKTDYPDTPLGRTKDQRQEFYGSIGWGDPSALRVFAFGDIEWVQYDSNHRVGTGNPDPATPPTTATYNWSAENKDNSWQVGFGADWAPRSRLKVKSSLLYTETEGRAEFRVQPGGATTPFQPITNFDNTKRIAFNLRGIYDWSRSLELTTGYAYERYRYSDIGYDNTRYVAGTGTGASYTTGQFAFQPYSANILYAMAKLKF
jgi:MtrB/PioB family decaheme-associated outer membrane protein